MTLRPGTRLGVFEVTAQIGEGGMGQVYRAHDARLNRDVALKVLPDSFASDPERIARFTREAQTLASLNHPNIAHIHGLEESPSTRSGQATIRALVMELVEGEDLSQRIARGAIPFDEALPIAKQIAEALEAAHEQGIIHRDLKPANIKVSPDGMVKVLDFGLAKAMEPAGSGLPSPTASAAKQDPAYGVSHSPTITTPAMMTGVGVLLGTAAYMSPEQAKGRTADKRSDVWAFGCVLYEMLTGKRAFEGEDVADTLAAVLRGEPDLSALPATVPPAVRLVVQRCLVKDRKQRIADMSVAHFLLNEPALAQAGATSRTATGAPMRLLPIAATIAILAGAIGGIAVWTFRPSTPSAPLTVMRFSVPLAQGQQFTGVSRQLLAISPDGTHMVYVAGYRLYLRSMSDLEARAIPGTEYATGGVTTPVFSPDGRSIAFWTGADQTIKRIAVTGGTPITICPAVNPFGMNWAGDAIVFGGPKGIMRVSANGGKPEQLVSVKDDEIAHGPQMLPDGQAVLFTLAKGAGTDRGDNAQLVVHALKSGDRKVLIEGGADARYVSTGHIVYALGGTLFAMPFDLGRLEVTGGPVPVVEGVLRVSTAQTGSAHFSVSNAGSAIYVPGPVSTSSGQQDLAWIDRNGLVEPLRLPRGTYESPRLSPDGTRVAFESEDGKDAIVWVYDLAGTSAMRRLTFGGRNRYPVWSADGQRVTFQSDREQDLGIFWQRADGTGTIERLTKPEPGTAHVPHAWAPKGDALLFSVTKGSDMALWTLSLSDRKVAPFRGVQSTSSISASAVFSPDGHWVAYASGVPQSAVFVQPFPATGAIYQVAGSGFYPLWSRDGKELFFTQPNQLTVVGVTTQPAFTVGNPTPLPRGFLASRAAGGGARPYDITPDGRRFIGMIMGDQTPSGAAAAPQIQVVLNWFEELKAKVPAGK